MRLIGIVDAERRPARRDEPVERVDLRALAAQDVLRRRRVLLRQRVGHAPDGVDQLALVERHAGGPRHRDRLAHRALHQCAYPRLSRHAPVAGAAECRDRVERAVDHELGPQRRIDVVRERARDSRRLEQRRDRGEAWRDPRTRGVRARCAEHEIAAAGVPHDARAVHVGTDVHHRGEHGLGQHGPQALGVVDAILQAGHDGVGSEVRREAPGRRVRVGRLHAHEHDLRIAHVRDVGRRAHPDRLASIGPLDDEPVAPDRLDVRRAADQRHRHAGAREHAAVVAADRAGAEYRDAQTSSHHSSVDSSAVGGRVTSSLSMRLPSMSTISNV